MPVVKGVFILNLSSHAHAGLELDSFFYVTDTPFTSKIVIFEHEYNFHYSNNEALLYFSQFLRVPASHLLFPHPQSNLDDWLQLDSVLFLHWGAVMDLSQSITIQGGNVLFMNLFYDLAG